jgi:hypothetical protein
VELGRYLCEVRAGQYWRLENLKSFDEFLERRLPESRRKAYYLMSIHEHLPPEAKRELKEVGWTKGLELAKLARAEGQRFDCATWLHKARSMPKDQFKREVEKELTGRETEPYEIIYFKLYKSQIPVIEQALETAALMLGTDKSRGYCLEMICADFLAGANLDNGNSDVLLQSVSRFFKFLPSVVLRGIVPSFTAGKNDFSDPYVGAWLWLHGQNPYDIPLSTATSVRLTRSQIAFQPIYLPTAYALLAPLSLLPLGMGEFRVGQP